jgi:hypothetical protein
MKTLRISYPASLVGHIARSHGQKMTHKQAEAWLDEHESQIHRTINGAMYGANALLDKLLHGDESPLTVKICELHRTDFFVLQKED